MSKEAAAIQLTIGAGGATLAAVGTPAVTVGVGAAIAVAAIGIGVYNLYSSRCSADEALPSTPDPRNISWVDLSNTENFFTGNQIESFPPESTEIFIIPDSEESSQVIIWQE